MPMKKRAISLLLVMVTLLGATGVAAAVEARSSYNLSSYRVTLTAKGNGKMEISVSIRGVEEQDKIGVQEIEIEHKTSANGSWTHYDTLYGASHPEFYAYNALRYSKEITFDGEPGEIYQVTITAYAKKGSNSDTGEATSSAVTCR